MTSRELEKRSSAFTLSDMEIFIFPELLYSLVLANIMSPVIWRWRRDKWFAGIEKMPLLKRIHRVKQYIMDHYDFNLDLETWGLTDKETEINRFSDFIDTGVLKQSNALFGYEGDKYYFDIDIRRHFGLDRYDTDIIPYWKTETVEAMDAFRHKPGHATGAGECVSLASLYAAAMFIVARIPLEDIFLLGTPLHSQVFLVAGDGILTNNRRILTRAMWYNGTELSALARRALEHEQVAVVAHSSGYIHSVYEDATIDKEVYRKFRDSFSAFLTSPVDFEIFINFIRAYSRHQRLFQLSFPCQGMAKFIPAAKAFAYEHGSKYRLGDKTARKLLCEIDEEELSLFPLDDLTVLCPDDELFYRKPYPEFMEAFGKAFPEIAMHKDLLADLKRFVHTVPRLPSGKKNFIGRSHLQTQPTPDQLPSQPMFSPDLSREEIINLLSSIQHPASSICLAFYSGRFMDHCDWKPFLKAALERNPVAVNYFRNCELHTAYCILNEWPGDSIYEENRLALPDEVMNFKRGDGIEKALTLANVIRNRDKTVAVTLNINGGEVLLKAGKDQFRFGSLKEFKKNLIV
jgi:hypothetical protein